MSPDGAALECGTDPPSIAAAITRGLATGEAGWRAMSGEALGLARGRFAPAQVAQQWVAAYRALVAEKAR